MNRESKLGRTAFVPPNFAIGKPFPEILLPSLAEERPRSMAHFRGRKTILHLFASW